MRLLWPLNQAIKSILNLQYHKNKCVKREIIRSFESTKNSCFEAVK